jgi:hypothetical protein
MGLPGREAAADWVGKTVVDREGTELGPCTAVFADDDTGLPEWMYVDVAGESTVVPVLDATETAGRVTVVVARSQVTAAPSVGETRALSQEQEVELYRHYGIEYSREASDSVLPAGAVEPSETTSGTAAAAATAPAAATTAGTPSAASTATATSGVGRPTGTSHAERDGAAAGGGGRALAAGAVVAGAAVAVAVLRGRRARARRLEACLQEARRLRGPAGLVQRLAARVRGASQAETPAERAARRARVAAELARVTAGRVGAAAAPVAATAAEAARRGAVVGARSARSAARASALQAAATTARVRARAGV